MDVVLKEKIDNLIHEISNEKDLCRKMELLNYVARQADFCIWTLEEEQRQFENTNSY